MRRVLKWTVPVDDHAHEVGSGPVCLVACQTSAEQVQVWTLESDATLGRTWLAQVYGTGHDVPEGALHLGSVMAADGALIWHLFAV